jgi:hypothetical protein
VVLAEGEEPVVVRAACEEEAVERAALEAGYFGAFSVERAEEPEPAAERWANREDRDKPEVWRVEVPGEGVVLARGRDREEAKAEAALLGGAPEEALLEACVARAAFDVPPGAAPGARELRIYPEEVENPADGEYAFAASYENLGPGVSLVGRSDESETEAVERLLGALESLGMSGPAVICLPCEPEPVPLAEWGRRPAVHPDGEASEAAGRGEA